MVMVALIVVMMIMNMFFFVDDERGGGDDCHGYGASEYGDSGVGNEEADNSDDGQLGSIKKNLKALI